MDGQPLYLPAPYQDQVDSGRLILRDGTSAAIRISTADDRQRLQEFFGRLSPESRQQRFMSAGLPPVELVERLCDSSQPASLLTLVVTRQAHSEERGIERGGERIVAAGSYLAHGDRTAEVAMAVEDAFQRKGIGTQLLERLAIIAIRNGFLRFWALTRIENVGMIEVFRHSGFTLTERVEEGVVEIDFAVAPTESSVQSSELRDRLFTAASIRPFFKPKSVAVIGASRNPSGIGYRILDELLRAGFRGVVYPVNPHAAAVRSIRSYASIQDVPETVELAIVAVPAAAVLAAIDACSVAGVRTVIVITAGFSEIGEAGRELQRQLLDKVRGNGMRMIGPNCMGLLNTSPEVRLNASFSPVFPPQGVLAMSSQSGALGLAVLAFAAQRQIGLSTFVSVGNKADVSGNDLIQYWETDNDTRVILLYLESFGNPRRFSRIARRVSRSKPIVAVKAGRSSAGRRAAGSHTAALAADDVAVDALFRQTGVIRAETLEEMFEIAATLGSQPLIRGRRIGIVTNAGGPGILCTDACEAGGLVVPELTAAAQDALRSFLPAVAGLSNPVDMIASAGADSYRRTIEVLLESAEIDALIVIYIPIERGDSAAIEQAIRAGIEHGRSAGGGGKPVLLCAMAGGESQSFFRTSSETIPVYAFPEAAAKVLARCSQYAAWQAEPPGVVRGFSDVRPEAARSAVRASLQRHGPGWLGAEEARAVLAAFGIAQARVGFARTAAEAVALAEAIGFPVAVKLASRRIVHKTEVDGVWLNLGDAAAVAAAFEAIAGTLAARNESDAMDGVTVQEMVSGGVELVVGVADDPLFGPLIAFGLGGIHVEILGDVRFRITPLTDKDAAAMVREIRGYRLLEGYRGHAPADIDAIVELLQRVSRMVEEIPEITDLDLNPVMTRPPGEGCRVLDARIKVAER